MATKADPEHINDGALKVETTMANDGTKSGPMHDDTTTTGVMNMTNTLHSQAQAASIPQARVAPQRREEAPPRQTPRALKYSFFVLASLWTAAFWQWANVYRPLPAEFRDQEQSRAGLQLQIDELMALPDAEPFMIYVLRNKLSNMEVLQDSTYKWRLYCFCVLFSASLYVQCWVGLGRMPSLLQTAAVLAAAVALGVHASTNYFSVAELLQ